MRPRTALLGILTCAALISTTACSNTTNGSPSIQLPAPPSTGGLPTDGAPSVDNPIANTAVAESDPCSTVTTPQIESLGGKVDRSRVDDMTLGKNCVWVFADGSGNVGAGMVTKNKDGLSGIYSQSARGGLTTFKPVEPIEGYPAVVYANGGEGAGVCTLAVGIRNDLVYTIIPRLRPQNHYLADPCGMATKIAQFAIQQLKAA
jgi:hypothetical protein